MQDFVDLPGASGAVYRFRAAEGPDHLPMAGNFAWVRLDDHGATVVVVGCADDLSKVASASRPKDAAGAKLFTRLNVGRAVREAEHQDLEARYGASARHARP